MFKVIQCHEDIFYVSGPWPSAFDNFNVVDGEKVGCPWNDHGWIFGNFFSSLHRLALHSEKDGRKTK